MEDSDIDEYDNTTDDDWYGDEYEFLSDSIYEPLSSTETDDPELFDYQTLTICDALQSHPESSITSQLPMDSSLVCSICANCSPSHCHKCLDCGHFFCNSCWLAHFDFQLSMGMSTGVECMETDCHHLVPECFALSMLTSQPHLRSKYEQLAFQDFVTDYFKLFCRVIRHCDFVPDCTSIIFAKNPAAKKTLCKTCGTQFCFKCGMDYHAPNSCETIERWFSKIDEESSPPVISAVTSVNEPLTSTTTSSAELFAPVPIETQLSAATSAELSAPSVSDTVNDESKFLSSIFVNLYCQRCPHCRVWIEKVGGCDHMYCTMCHHHFDWLQVSGLNTRMQYQGYHEFNRYRTTPIQEYHESFNQYRKPPIPKPIVPPPVPDITPEREKYLSYYQRWEEHSKSLKLKEQQIQNQIDDKIAQHDGTSIDYQYLYEAAALLTKCRYTLQYTYPYAYFMESEIEKELFEFQQAQMERVIEQLESQLEMTQVTNLGPLKTMMNVTDQTHKSLLKRWAQP